LTYNGLHGGDIAEDTTLYIIMYVENIIYYFAQNPAMNVKHLTRAKHLELPVT
jgi:hypothetical protein